MHTRLRAPGDSHGAALVELEHMAEIARTPEPVEWSHIGPIVRARSTRAGATWHTVAVTTAPRRYIYTTHATPDLVPSAYRRPHPTMPARGWILEEQR